MLRPRQFVKLRGVALVSAGAVLLTVGTAAGAFAVFSSEVHSSQLVEAGTVVIDGTGPLPLALRYVDLAPGEPAAEQLSLHYSGTVPADLVVDVEPAGDTAFCQKGPDDAWEPLPGGALEIRVEEGEWVDYCSLFEETASLTLRQDVGPGSDLDLRIEAQLRPGTDYRYFGLEESDQLIVRAEESGHPNGFSDKLLGSIEISTAITPPPIPQHCIDAGLTDFDADNTIYLTKGADDYQTGKPAGGGRGFLVFGFGGNDHIVGSNQGDCIDGGPGNDELWGANQSDVVIGGPGNDVLNGPDGGAADTKSNGKDLLYGGGGDDLIYGGNAKDSISGDSLFGDDGDDTLVGGRGADIVDGGGEVDVCIDASGSDDDIMDNFVNCESVVRALNDADLADLVSTTTH